ncbi:MAG TPA: hypothetical protein VME43_19005 [Bryobacteraceae bacterium]|nr:hypothetical protein [Bryobacteraceae bacterium]
MKLKLITEADNELSRAANSLDDAVRQGKPAGISHAARAAEKAADTVETRRTELMHFLVELHKADNTYRISRETWGLVVRSAVRSIDQVREVRKKIVAATS